MPVAKNASRTERRLRAVAMAATLLIAATTAHAAQGTSAKGITVAQPWARATPGGAKVGAAYLTIAADKGTQDRLVAARSAVAGRVELHTHIMDGEVMKMRRVEAIAVGDGKTVLLQPGGDHVMLIDLKAPLKQGEPIKLTLVFEKAGEIEVEAGVEPIGAKGPRGLDTQPAADGSRVGGGKAGGADPHAHHKH